MVEGAPSVGWPEEDPHSMSGGWPAQNAHVPAAVAGTVPGEMVGHCGPAQV